MSIKTVLIGGVLLVTFAAIGLIAGLGAYSISGTVMRNAQNVVNRDLEIALRAPSGLQANKSEIDFKSDVIDATLIQAEALFSSRSITLQVDCPESLKVTADPELLRITLNNYLSNAAKYGKEGGAARLSAGLENGELLLTVWNEGAGFTKEDGAKLFQKFSRLKNANTRDKRGSGLGLFLCKQILDLHQGRVWAESTPGEWAKFCFSFPAQQGLSAAV